MQKKDYINLLLITVIGLIIIIIILIPNNLFGSKTDWISQHFIIPEYFRNLFYDTGNLFPNFAPNIGAGQNIYDFAYYGLLSPIILFSYLLPWIEMKDYIMVTSFLSIFISVFLLYRWLQNDGFSSKICFITSTLMLLSSPLIFHSHRHIMFVNYMPFLILALIGTDIYFNKNKKILLILSVFLMIMTSYYYSIGGIITVIIYGIYKYLEINKKIKLIKFLLESIKLISFIFVSVLMAGILLFPTLANIINNNGFVEGLDYDFKLLIPNFNIETLLYSSYSLGFTTIALVALLNKIFTKKKEQIFLGVVLFMFLFIPVFIYLLNGTLYIRAKVLIPFLPLIALLISHFFDNLFYKKINYFKLLTIILILSILVYVNNRINVIYIIDISITITVLITYKYIKKDYLVYIPILIIAFFSCLVVNLNDELITKANYKQNFKKETQRLIDYTISSDQTFYRFNNLNNPLSTINKIYNPRYYQTSLYSSTFNSTYNNFFYDVFNNPIPYRNRVITAQANSILFQTLMGVKYILSDVEAPIGYKMIYQIGQEKLYKNINVFPLGYVTDKVMDYNQFNSLKYPYKLDAIMRYAVVDGNSDNQFSSAVKPINLNYQIEVGSNISIIEEKDYYFVDVKASDYINIKLNQSLIDKVLFIKFNVMEAPSCKKGDISIKINDITNKLTCKSWMYHNQNYFFEYNISSTESIKQLKVKFSKGKYKIKNIRTYIMDYNDIKDVVNTIDKMIVNVKKTSGDKIVGHINATKNGYFVMTIPYDKGFTITLNGQKQTYEKVNAGFVGFSIKKGIYNIEIEYNSPWFKIGVFSTIVGFLCLLIIVVYDKCFKKS